MLHITLPDGSAKIGRLAVPRLPELICLALGDGQATAGGSLHLRVAAEMRGEVDGRPLLSLPDLQVHAVPVPLARSAALELRYDALSASDEDLGAFLGRHGLHDLTLPPSSAYSLTARGRVDHAGHVDGFLQINGLERDPSCTPQSPGCTPEVSTELWRASLRTL